MEPPAFDPNARTTPQHTEWRPPPAGDAPPELPGYVVEHEIGRGGVGVVYLAQELALGRSVAIKTLLPHIPPDGPTARRFLNEARVTAQLVHPGIPPVHAVGRLADGRPFLAMKLVRGLVLTDALADLAATIEGRLRGMTVFERVCEAVGYAHSHGVVHRDLKPGNVMIGAFGEVHVMDWGLAKLTGQPADDAADPGGPVGDGLTRAGDVFGTPGYMPPEQARGEPVDARADVFALGSILAVILTGKPAYTGETTDEILRRTVAGDESELLARLADRARERGEAALVRRCLAADPAARPADAGELAELIRQDRVAAVRRERRRARSLFLVGSLSALAFVALVVGAGVFAAGRVYDRTTHDVGRETDGTLVRTAWYGRGAIERALQDRVSFVEEHAVVPPDLRDRLTAAASVAELPADRTAFDAYIASVHRDARQRWPAVEGRMVSLLVVAGDTPDGGPARGFTLAQETAGVSAAADRADPRQAALYRSDRSFRDYFSAGGNRFDEEGRPHPVVRRTHISHTYQSRRDGSWRIDVATPVWAADGRVVGLLSIGIDVNHHLRTLIDMPDRFLAEGQELARAVEPFVVNDRGAWVWHAEGMAALEADAARGVQRDPENVTALARRQAAEHGRSPDALVPWRSAAGGVEDGPSRYVDPVTLGTPAGGAELLSHTLTFRPFAHSRYADGRDRTWGFVAQVPEAVALDPVEHLKGQLAWAGAILAGTLGGLVVVLWVWLFRLLRGRENER